MDLKISDYIFLFISLIFSVLYYKDFMAVVGFFMATLFLLGLIKIIVNDT